MAKEINAKKDYYEILGVAKDADDNTIKKAYRRVSTRVIFNMIF
jgi:DnaJ-class molecular chaperone